MKARAVGGALSSVACVCVMTWVGAAGAVPIDPADSDILYTGRWDHSSASSQQTNPASNGGIHPLAVWMRGANDGDEVDVTLEFRDQESGAEVSSPLQTETETKLLTTSWQRYEMTATAPESPPNPVYSVRVIFSAGAGDSVDIDAVKLGDSAAVPSLGPAATVLALALGLTGALSSRRLRQEPPT